MIYATYADRRNHVARHGVTRRQPLRWLQSWWRDTIDGMLFYRVVV